VALEIHLSIESEVSHSAATYHTNSTAAHLIVLDMSLDCISKTKLGFPTLP
jgi:hypothetical protein